MALLNPERWAADWPRTLAKIGLTGLREVSYQAEYVNPRTGIREPAFRATSTAGAYTVEPGRPWISAAPTGEDWALVLTPDKGPA
jgi:hypothetical protein